MHTLDFITSTTDRNVWTKLDADRNCYSYVPFYVDDYDDFSRDPDSTKGLLDAHFTSKIYGEKKNFTGADYIELNGKTHTCLRTYLKDAFSQLKELIPNNGILTWIRSRLRVDIAYVLSIINQFVAKPREDTLTQW